MEVIIVDDEPVSLAVLKKLVSKLPDCQPRAFSQASAALAWCESNDPDVIIVDYMMPELDGIEFTRRLRIEAKADTPMLMVSANADPDVRDRALETGVDDFLHKPFDSVDLQARVGNMLALRSSQKKRAKENSLTIEIESTRVEASRSEVAKAANVMDVHATLARLGGDTALVSEVARIFTQTVPPLLTLLRDAMDDSNLHAVYEGAHSLKGAVGAVEAPQVLQSVIELEAHARKGDARAVAAAFTSAQALVWRLMSELAEMASV
jgi:DNA-binding response OmpR family regulator